MRYVFKLEPLLNYRDRLKEIAEQELAKRINELMGAQQKLNDLKMQEEQCLSEMINRQSEGIFVSQYLLYWEYLKVLSGYIDHQRQEIERLDQAVLESRQNLIKASKEKQILDRIKEKDFDAFKREVARIEQKENDELVVMRHCRKNILTGKPEHA